MKNHTPTVNKFCLLGNSAQQLMMAAVLMFVINQALLAQSPPAFSYQAVIRDNAGEFLANQTVGIRISIHAATTSGTIVYQETHQVTSNLVGLINLSIGLGSPTTGVFSTISWSGGLMFLQVEADKTGGTNYITLGTTQLVSVPYALYAPPDADWIVSGAKMYSGVTGNVGIGYANPSNKLHVEGSDALPILNVKNNGGGRGIRVFTQSSCALWVENSGNHGLRVTHCLGNGVNITAAHGNGIHVDQADGWAGYFNGTGYFSGNVGIGNLTPGAKLHVNGNIIANDPVDPTHVATKQYVDQKLKNYADKIQELENSVQKLIEINETQKQRIKKLEDSL
jgi:hypothetical protein